MTLIDEREVMFEQERKQKIIKNIMDINSIGLVVSSQKQK